MHNLLSIINGPWAITPEMLKEIQRIYGVHLAGPKIEFDKQAAIKSIEARLGRPLRNERVFLQNNNGVGLLSVKGVIAKRMNLFMEISGGVSNEIARQEFLQAVEDPDIKSIVLDMDTPGGTVSGTFEFAQAVADSRGKKPIVAFTDGMMASAGYAIGSAADRVIISGDTTMVGSIGVVARHIDYSKQLEADGVKVTDITAGKYKRTYSEAMPLSEEGRAEIQAELDYLYSAFVNFVAANRDLDTSNLETWAEGRVFIGKQAIEAGLVDGVSTIEDLLSELAGGDSAVSTGAYTATKTTAKEKKTMDVATLKKDHPDVYEAIFKAGADSVDVSGKVSEALAAETQRVKEVLSMSRPGFEELVAQMAVDGKSTKAEVALAMFDKHEASAKAESEKIIKRAQSIDVPGTTPAGDAGGAGSKFAGLSGKELWTAEFNDDPKLSEEFGSLEGYMTHREMGGDR